MRTSLERGFPRCTLLSAIALLACLLWPREASAHARLLRSTPARDSSGKAPEAVELWFNELLENSFNIVSVFPASELAAKKHAELLAEKPMLDPKDRTHLRARLKPLRAGEYILEWRVLSQDGHSAPGRLTFRVVAGS